jgi:hypothetical protein
MSWCVESRREYVPAFSSDRYRLKKTVPGGVDHRSVIAPEG